MMPRLSGPYGVGAFFILVSAFLYLLTTAFVGWSTAIVWYVPIGVLSLAIVAGLTRGLRWLAYVAFFWVCLGSIDALGRMWSAAPVPGWWLLAIAIVGGLAAAALFGALWRTLPDQLDL